MSDLIYSNVMLDLETMGNGPNAAIAPSKPYIVTYPSSASATTTTPWTMPRPRPSTYYASCGRNTAGRR